MPSRREQIQSYQYLTQRVVNAFVSGEADPSMSPTRRLAGAGFASVMAAVLVLTVFGVIGLVKHGGNTSWQDGGAIVIEKETGTRYVYRDGVLYPVANYSSAVLVIGQPATTVSVSRESLTGARRGPLIGITGAPDALPPAGRMSRAAWSMCAVPGRDSSGGATVSSQIMVGTKPNGGHDLGDSAIVVREALSQKSYLVWNAHRYRVDARQTFAAMGIDAQPRLLVDEAWLDTVPQGLPITQPQVDNRGKTSTALKNYLIGQVLTVSVGGSTTGYLVRDKDVVPVTPIEQALILADPGTAAAYPGSTPQAKPIQAAEVANTPKAGRAKSDLDPPAQVPSMADADTAGTLCTTFADGQAAPGFLINADPQPDTAGIATSGGGGTEQVATRVVVPSGSGAIVRAAQSADTESGQVFFVTDQGRRYALMSPAQLAWFGYGAIKPIELPSFVVARIPAGPGLDPRAAQRPVTG
ncbi:type VII secretion protein EccB [Dactylosporangium matsuzakiense]|uniref:Type VII secretion protein EccB n=1 Tax=Dactylosporangium matsuzakiense TaxID=53360 RepID=A0A9W6KL53_9ACTN|nr:type VII secretion protein EccB [Dactylosporangium matsuzakiense]UWZ45963.1 type VII secretion protein EccB [Dactylosporangium matsuzakiense]GLL02865.1 type VII secretion protein EccB [Dactylosporangium matsuzakiense]